MWKGLLVVKGRHWNSCQSFILLQHENFLNPKFSTLPICFFEHSFAKLQLSCKKSVSIIYHTEAIQVCANFKSKETFLVAIHQGIFFGIFHSGIKNVLVREFSQRFFKISVFQNRLLKEIQSKQTVWVQLFRKGKEKKQTSSFV